MPDIHVKTTTTGYGSRIVNSIKGIAMGILLFFASFAVLYWNEGRVNLSTVAVDAVEISATELSSTADGQQVFVTGEVTAEGLPIGDELYLIEGDYLAVKRNVEMYAWVEETSSESDTNLGGSETTTTTYDYREEWVDADMVSDGSDFEYTGYNNPTPSYVGETFYASGGMVGVYGFDLESVELPAFKNLTMKEETFYGDGWAELKGSQVYVDYTGDGSQQPELGDLRISYEVLENGAKGTVFGKLDGTDIVAFVDLDNDNARIYRMFTGTRDEALSTLDSEHTFMTWVYRGVGFLMMWIGLSMLFGPVSVLLDVVPFFGSLSRGLISVTTFIVAAILSIVTIVISMIVHNIYALVISVLVIVGIVMWLIKRKGNKPKKVKA